MKQMVAAASWIAFSVLAALGQGTTDTPEFEVASVKPADMRDRSPLPPLPGPVAEIVGFDGGPGTQDPDRINYRGVSLKMLLARAYKVKPDQIVGPGWLGSERYTIEAKLPPGTDADRLRLMLQKLLAERFRISLHRETKETPVYRLRVARNGPGLKPPQDLPHYDSEDERREAMRKELIENMAKMKAAVEAGSRSGIRTNNRRFALARATTEKFAEVLSGNLDRPVKDMTQLEGEYSFRLEWTPDSDLRDDEPSSRVSIFTAIQEQLGLKLEAGNEAIELLVIDKADKTPTSN
jgi:uncharacterized protein (TIGR03435 family)